jgi:hypothetical protein
MNWRNCMLNLAEEVISEIKYDSEKIIHEGTQGNEDKENRKERLK